MAANEQATGTADVTGAAEIQIRPLAHLIAPIAAIGATMLVRKLMNDGYRKVSGGPVPTPSDPAVTFGRALMWTAITAATAAVVEVAVFRLANQWGAREVPPRT